jgi:hypothetical protein
MNTENNFLIDYLDKQLSGEESGQAEQMIQQDPAAAREFQYLKLAVDTVRRDAIQARVSAVRQSVENNAARTVKPPGAILHRMYSGSLRIAAIVLLFLVSAVVYKYISVNNVSVYNRQFSGYELGTLRGPGAHDSQSEAYRNKNWNEVVADYNAENNPTRKSVFLAAMAQMELAHFPQAVALFEKILNADAAGNDSFREEAEYYGALAYLRNHQADKGIAMLARIKADTSHTYWPLAARLSAMDMKIIELKK